MLLFLILFTKHSFLTQVLNSFPSNIISHGLLIILATFYQQLHTQYLYYNNHKFTYYWRAVAQFLSQILLESMLALLTLKYNTEIAGIFGCPDKIDRPEIGTKILLYFLLLNGLVKDSLEIYRSVSILRVYVLVDCLQIERHLDTPLRNLHICMNTLFLYNLNYLAKDSGSANVSNLVLRRQAPLRKLYPVIKESKPASWHSKESNLYSAKSSSMSICTDPWPLSPSFLIAK